MLVRSLGFEPLAGTMRNVDLPFEDVSSGAPYIAMAYDFGIITGLTPDGFRPVGLRPARAGGGDDDPAA
jgi:hypothetical protein